MKRKNYNNDQTIRGIIIRIIMMVGFLPAKALVVLEPTREKNYKRKLREMMMDGELTKSGISINRKMYQLFYLDNVRKFIELHGGELEKEYVDYFRNFQIHNLSVALQRKTKKRTKKNLSQQIRAIIEAFAFIVMKAAGVKVDVNDKPNLSDNAKLDRNKSYYYSSREIKRSDNYSSFQPEGIGRNQNANTKRTTSAILNGVLIASSGMYSVYMFVNINKITYFNEAKFLNHIDRLFSRSNIEDKGHSAIYFYNDIGDFTTSIDYCINHTSAIKRNSIIPPYESFYVLPYSKEGRQFLELIQIKNWEMIIIDKLFQDRYEKTYETNTYYDKKHDRYVYSFIVPELKELISRLRPLKKK